MENYTKKLIEVGARKLNITVDFNDEESIVSVVIKFYHKDELLYSADQFGLFEFNLEDCIKAAYDDYLDKYINKK